MTRKADYTLLVTSADGTSLLWDPIGTSDPLQQRPGWSRIEAHPRHNQVGSGTFTISAIPDLLTALYTPDARLIVRRAVDDRPGTFDYVMSGPIEQPDTGFDISRDGTDGFGTVTVNFGSDLALAANRLVYPDPAHESNAQTAAKYTYTNVNPETVAYNLANLNVGPGAIASRRQAGMTVRATQGLAAGKTISGEFTRDWILTDALREVDRLAKVAGVTTGIGFRVVQNGAAGIQFQTFGPQDLTASVVFSRALGNVTAGHYAVSAPTVTHALTGDSTAGVGRIISERVNTAAIAAGWNRREAFVDARGATNLAAQQTTGDQALTDGGPKTLAAVTAVETVDCRYDYEFTAGDLVSYLPYVGGPYVTTTCLGADIIVTEAGEDVTPLIGTDDTGVNFDAKATEIRRLWTAVSRIQGAL